MILDFLKTDDLSPGHYAVAFNTALLDDPGERLYDKFRRVVEREEKRLGADLDSIWAKLERRPEIKQLLKRRDEIDEKYPSIIDKPEEIFIEEADINGKLTDASDEIESSEVIRKAQEQARAIAEAEAPMPERNTDFAAKVFTTYVLKRLCNDLATEYRAASTANVMEKLEAKYGTHLTSQFRNTSDQEASNSNTKDFTAFVETQRRHIQNAGALHNQSSKGNDALDQAGVVLKWMYDTNQLEEPYNSDSMDLSKWLKNLDIEAVFESFEQQSPNPAQKPDDPNELHA